MSFKHNVHVFPAPASVYETRHSLQRDINNKLGRNEHIVSVKYIDGQWWVFTETFGLELSKENKA